MQKCNSAAWDILLLHLQEATGRSVLPSHANNAMCIVLLNLNLVDSTNAKWQKGFYLATSVLLAAVRQVEGCGNPSGEDLTLGKQLSTQVISLCGSLWHRS